MWGTCVKQIIKSMLSMWTIKHMLEGVRNSESNSHDWAHLMSGIEDGFKRGTLSLDLNRNGTMATQPSLTNQILTYLSSLECLPFVWALLKALRRSLKQRRNFKTSNTNCLGRICFYILRSRLLVLCMVLIGAKTRMKIYTNTSLNHGVS